MPHPPTFADRFREHLRELGLGREPETVLVALSGGRDSVVLLHLLRDAAPELRLTLAAAHLDHALREDSAADAAWVQDLCHDWEIPLVRERLPEAPRSEGEARRARYDFLRRTAEAVGAERIATGHHADDQAETVLFRIVRGTGLRGLGGIPARTPSGLVRPLLPFWRAEIDAYAREAGLSWREDPTNRSGDAAVRNRIRHRILPELERLVSPGARRALVSLAAHARSSERAWSRRVSAAERRLVREEEGGVVIAREPLRRYDPEVATRLLRRLLRRFGVVPGRAGTRAALQFITDAPSGRGMRLPGGVRILLEFDRARLEPDRPGAPDEPLEIPVAPAAEEVEGRARIGGREYRVRYRIAPGGTAADDDPWSVALDPGGLRFPLRVRGWVPGDRVRTSGGTKSLKKLLLEERIPASRRRRLPVLVDADDRVLWVAGIRRTRPTTAPGAGAALVLTISDD